MILIALGSNIAGRWGAPREAVLRALETMPDHAIDVVAASSLWETKPFGVTDQPNFVNAVGHVETSLPPEDLMQTLHDIERQAGRERKLRWGPRTLDLDLIDYNGMILQPEKGSANQLILPHPGIAERDFVLGPLLEVAPDWMHPLTQESATLSFQKLSRLNRP
jgi:2-amino-4-hydroxy-6-hydroxymethyldihydropteridine diphosphokinase